jgi:hypothetical protein
MFCETSQIYEIYEISLYLHGVVFLKYYEMSGPLIFGDILFTQPSIP